jgi:hypothetical protein
VRERVLRICVEREAKGERGERERERGEAGEGERGERERVCASSLGKVLRKRGNEVRRVSA